MKLHDMVVLGVNGEVLLRRSGVYDTLEFDDRAGADANRFFAGVDRGADSCDGDAGDSGGASVTI